MRVSFITPCYNSGAFLLENIHSIEAQTYADTEHIIINDGSTDEATIEILDSLRAAGHHIIDTTNHGPASARNTGIAAATGEIIIALDSDDKLGRHYAQKVVDSFQIHPENPIVVPVSHYFGEKTGPIPYPKFSMGVMLFRNLLPVASAYRRTDWEKVGGYRQTNVEDYDLFLRILNLGGNPRFLDKGPDYYYRIHAGQRSQESNQYKTFDAKEIAATQAAAMREVPELYIKHAESLWNEILAQHHRYQIFYQMKARYGPIETRINKVGGFVKKLLAKIKKR